MNVDRISCTYYLLPK